MRTETDLWAAFRALEETADSYGTPEFDIAATRVDEPPARIGGRHSRVVLSSLAAAAAVVVAVGTAAVISRLESPSDRRGVVGGPTSHGSTSSVPTTRATVPLVAPRSFGLRRLWFTLDPIPGAVVTGYRLFADAQMVELESSDGQHWDVTLSAAGAQQPRSSTGAEAVSVAGHPGYYGYLTQVPFAAPADRPVGLVWQYAPGAWATAVSADTTAISSDDAARVAAAVVPGHPQAVAVPIRLGSAPPGTRLQGYLGGAGGSGIGQHGTTGVNALIDFSTDGSGTAFTVDLEPRTAGATYSGTEATVGGRTAYVVDNSVTILDGDYVAHLGPMPGTGAARLTAAQVLAVARTLSFAANPTDQSTWFDATTALP